MLTNRNKDPHEDLNEDPVKDFVFEKNLTVCYEGGLCSILPLRKIKVNVDDLRKTFREKYNESYI